MNFDSYYMLFSVIFIINLNDMQRPQIIPELEAKRLYYQRRIRQQPFKHYQLNTQILSNPFLRDQQKYHYLLYTLNEYNKKVARGEVTDTFQSLTFQSLQSILSDMTQMFTKQDQVTRLSQVYDWIKNQQKLLEQRKDQGVTKYKNLRHFNIQDLKDKPECSEAADEEIITNMIQELLKPFKNKNRTAHYQADIPSRRLQQYKRKIINIAPFIEQKQEVKKARVLYPMPVKPEQHKQEQQEKDAEVKDGQIKEGQQGKQGQLKQGQQKQGQAAKPQEQAQDLGGFGQQPQQPDQDEKPQEQQGKDVLGPKVKLFTAPIQQKGKRKYYKYPYLFANGSQNLYERNCQKRYAKIIQTMDRRHKQQSENIQTAHIWAKTKSKINKQMQTKLENMLFKPKYSFMKENPPESEKLSLQEEIKYGFSLPIRANRKNSLDMTVPQKLPKIDNEYVTEKSFGKDRLRSLKTKFSKILNFTEYQQRENQPSLCQYSIRRRGLSEIIRNNSKSKQRLHQIQQISKIKEKLAMSKISLSLNSLSQGLCLPQQEAQSQGKYPDKMLPSNPFMVQTKKKKKKK